MTLVDVLAQSWYVFLDKTLFLFFWEIEAMKFHVQNVVVPVTFKPVVLALYIEGVIF